MDLLIGLWRELVEKLERLGLNAKLEAAKAWLRDDTCKPQRRIAFAASVFLLAVIILLLTNCSGGPQINP